MNAPGTPSNEYQVNEHLIMETKVAKLFSDVLNVEVPSATTDLFETGIFDSQKFVELLLHLEEQFGMHVNIEDLEIDNFRCLEKIATFVLQHKSSVKADSLSQTTSSRF